MAGWAKKAARSLARTRRGAGLSTPWMAPRIFCTGSRIGRFRSAGTQGEVVAGVIYDPSKDELFFAEKGQGAWLNEGRLRVSNRHRLIESVLQPGCRTVAVPNLPETLQDLARVLPVTAGVRRWGGLRWTWLMWLPVDSKGIGSGPGSLGRRRGDDYCARGRGVGRDCFGIG